MSFVRPMLQSGGMTDGSLRERRQWQPITYGANAAHNPNPPIIIEPAEVTVSSGAIYLTLMSRIQQILGGVSYLAPSGATERLFFNDSSGNLTSEDFIDIYAANGAGIQYGVSGPSGLVGIKCDADTEYFECTGPNAGHRPRTSNFVVIIQFIHHSTADAFDQYIFDFDYNGSGTQAGFSLLMNATDIDFAVCDGTNTHITRFAHSGIIYKEDAFYTLRYVFDKATTKGELSTKKEGQSEVSQTTTSVIANLSTVGDINPAGGMTFAQRENLGTFGAVVTLFQYAITIGSTTYDFPAKP